MKGPSLLRCLGCLKILIYLLNVYILSKEIIWKLRYTSAFALFPLSAGKLSINATMPLSLAASSQQKQNRHVWQMRWCFRARVVPFFYPSFSKKLFFLMLFWKLYPPYYYLRLTRVSILRRILSASVMILLHLGAFLTVINSPLILANQITLIYLLLYTYWHPFKPI